MGQAKGEGKRNKGGGNIPKLSQLCCAKEGADVQAEGGRGIMWKWTWGMTWAARGPVWVS